MGDTVVLEQLQELVTETGTALKSIGERLDKADKAVTGHDDRFKLVDDQCKKLVLDLGLAQKSLNEHIETTRKVLKELPAGVHSGGHDIPPEPWNTRGNGSGFQFTDIRACKAFGLFLMAHCAYEQDLRSSALKSLDKAQNQRWYGDAFKALSTGDFAAGGALVPDSFLADIIRNVETFGQFAVNAGRIPMSSPTVTIPKSLTELTVYYPEENVNITESEPTLGDVTLNARLYATLAKWSNTLVEDAAIDFGAYMAELIAYAHARAVDLNGFRGDGTSTYARVIGAMNAVGVVVHILGNATGASATNTAKTTFGHLAYGDLVSAQALLPTNARAGAKWYCHRYVAGIMRSIVDTNGRPIFAVDYVNGQRVQRILGDDLVEVDVMPSTTGTATDFILYGDLRQAMGFGERRSMRIENSKEAGFAADQTWVRSTARRAIAPLAGTQLVKLRTSST